MHTVIPARAFGFAAPPSLRGDQHDGFLGVRWGWDQAASPQGDGHGEVARKDFAPMSAETASRGHHSVR